MDDIPAGCSKFAEYPIERHLSALRAHDEVGLAIMAPVGFAPDPEIMFENLRAAERWKSETGNGSAKVAALLAMEVEFFRRGYFEKDGVAGARFSIENKTSADLEAMGFPEGDWARCLELFAETGRQLHVRTNDKHTLIHLFKTVPSPVVIALDHLGVKPGELDPGEPVLQEMLQAARSRGNVYFKGPGYRTALQTEGAVPLVCEIIRICGAESIWLGATDAPFLWSDATTGECLQEVIPSPSWVLDYVEALAGQVASKMSVDAGALLSGNALAAGERLPG